MSKPTSQAVKKARKLVANDSSEESSLEDLTEQDVQDLKVELAKSLPAKDVEDITNAFMKLTPGKTDQEKAQGFISWSM